MLIEQVPFLEPTTDHKINLSREIAMNIKEMTGLEILKAMMQGQIPPASISEIIPMQPQKIEQGNVRVCCKS